MGVVAAIFIAVDNGSVPIFIGFIDYINVSGTPGLGYNIIGRDPN